LCDLRGFFFDIIVKKKKVKKKKTLWQGPQLLLTGRAHLVQRQRALKTTPLVSGRRGA
jgi:hypothetical protein